MATKQSKCVREHPLTFKSWAKMIERCTNPNHQAYKSYGGRGITVCERWRSFANFLADMGERPSRGMSIDRIDVNGNYEHANCRWSTQAQQCRNRRNNKLTEESASEIRRRVEQGETQRSVAAAFGVSQKLVLEIARCRSWRIS